MICPQVTDNITQNQQEQAQPFLTYELILDSLDQVVLFPDKSLQYFSVSDNSAHYFYLKEDHPQ